MQNLIALTALHIAGRWLSPGATVPGNVAGYDYARAYQKGMLEAEDGSEVLNPEAETETVPITSEAAELGSDEESLRTQAAQLTRERDAALRDLEAVQQLSAGRLAQLEDYLDVVGELLPASFPARKVLLENGYYGLATLSGIDRETLLAMDGIGPKLADSVLALVPAEEPAADQTQEQ